MERFTPSRILRARANSTSISTPNITESLVMIDAKNLETLLHPILVKFRKRLNQSLPAFTTFGQVLDKRRKIPVGVYDVVKTRVHKISGSAKILGFEALGESAAEVEACIDNMDQSGTDRVGSEELVRAFDKFLSLVIPAAVSGAMNHKQQRGIPTEVRLMPKYKVLIIDDDEFARDLVKLSLTGEDCQFIEAETGKEGLECLNYQIPDLVVLDVNLPDINGFDILKEIMSKDLKKFPVVMLTREGGVDDQVTGIVAGATDYVVKPATLGKLNKALMDNIKYKESRHDDHTVLTRHEQIMNTMTRLEYW